MVTLVIIIAFIFLISYAGSRYFPRKNITELDSAALIRKDRQKYLDYEVEAMELWEDRFDPDRKKKPIPALFDPMLFIPDEVVPPPKYLNMKPGASNTTNGFDDAMRRSRFLQEMERVKREIEHQSLGSVSRREAWVSKDLRQVGPRRPVQTSSRIRAWYQATGEDPASTERAGNR